MARTSDLRELDDAELAQQLADAEKELFNLRFQLATGRLDNVSRISTVRRQVARLLTLQSEREHGIERVARPRQRPERARRRLIGERTLGVFAGARRDGGRSRGAARAAGAGGEEEPSAARARQPVDGADGSDVAEREPGRELATGEAASRDETGEGER
jgi:large subunit ribosomal protein L29